MTTYTVSLELANRQDYAVLSQELKRLRAHRSQRSVWLINANVTAQVLHDHLRRFVDSNDQVWVSELTTNNAYSKSRSGTTDWIRSQRPAR